VALKAVDLDRCIVVATLTKIAGFGIDTLTGLAGVTSNTFLQGILAGTDAAAQRVIALVLEKFHVVTTHERGLFYTSASARLFDQGLQCASDRCCWRFIARAGAQTGAQQQASTNHLAPVAKN
jgi:hypothetical protein